MASLPLNAPIASIADILHAAMSLGSDAWRARNADDNNVPARNDLADDLRELFTLLRDRRIPYLLVGGVALLKYVDGRNTEDIHLVLAATALPTLPEIRIDSQDKDFARGEFRHLPVDILLSSNPVPGLAQEKHATIHRFADLDVPCATPEGLVLLKLYALPSLYRQGNTQRAALYESDITMLLDRHPIPTEPILSTLALHLDAGSLRELQTIAAECNARVARMRNARTQ